MPATVTQKGRLLSLETPLGEDKLLAQDFSGNEGVSSLFTFRLRVLSVRSSASDAPLSLEPLMGKGVALALTRADRSQRFFHGIVNRWGHLGQEERFFGYFIEVVPWLWFLTQSADCRIFQFMTVPDIIKQVFKNLGYQDFRESLTRTYTKLDYCVQYRESHFNFISRLMEQEGIFYFFEHQKNKHVLVLADSPQAHQPCPGQATARYQPLGGGTGAPEDLVASWEMEQAIRPGKVTLRDYHFEMPGKNLQVSRPSKINVGGNSKLEVYDYPGGYAHRFNKTAQRLGDVEPEGATLARLQMEEEESPHVISSGSSTCRGFAPGFRFELTHYPPLNAPYVVTSVQHSIVQSPEYATGEEAKDAYTNTFSCLPLRIPFRPARTTRRPVIQGPQTAVVVGVKGEEIYTDRYGRVKVQFHWDRENKKDENSSCWVRVAQPIAGKRWGASFWPRIGQEVVVEFLEGDPEQPLIVGCVYNAEQLPPYLGDGLDTKHPNDPKVSGVKSNTTLGGKGYNEWRFDDTRDKEQVFLHAQRNMDVRVKNDHMERILNNRHLVVGQEKDGQKVGDQLERVYRDQHLRVQRNQAEKIEGNVQLLVGGSSDGGNVDVVIRKDQKELVEGNDHRHVKKDRNEKVDGNQSLTVGGSQQEKVSTNHALEAGTEIHVKAGTTLILEAGVQLSLKVGGNFIDINPSGVTIQGTMVLINSGGAAGTGSGSRPTEPQDAKEASPTDPTEADDSKSGAKSAP